MTYLFWGELSDSWPASLHRMGARWGCFEGEKDLRAMRRAGLDLGTSGACAMKIPACISGTGNSFVALV
jgi:hypothetical protein